MKNVANTTHTRSYKWMYEAASSIAWSIQSDARGKFAYRFGTLYQDHIYDFTIKKYGKRQSKRILSKRFLKNDYIRDLIINIAVNIDDQIYIYTCENLIADQIQRVIDLQRKSIQTIRNIRFKYGKR